MPRIVLFQPQIPPNTGNVARTCVATGSALHLIEPLGFSLEHRQLKRAGLDYWPALQLSLHPSCEAFQAERARQGGRLLGFSSHAEHPYDELTYASDDWLLFGRETDGLPQEVLSRCDQQLRIPIRPWERGQVEGVRSLNLSVAVAVVLFEALRQLRLGGPAG
ncbi:MAG: tRNA (cytidine(34)-2'-O)-methyltransferase [Synechococcaceae cyanobacterium]